MATVKAARASRGGRLRFTLAGVLALAIAGCGGASPSSAPPVPGASSSLGAAAPSATVPSKAVMVVGTDISDARTMDPHRTFDFSPGLSLNAVYQNLITVRAPNYSEL